MDAVNLDYVNSLSHADKIRYWMLKAWLEDMRDAYEVYKAGVMKKTGCQEEEIRLLIVSERG